MKFDRAYRVLMSRGFSLAYSAVMTLAFGAVGLFLVEHGSVAQLVWIFGAGCHFGMGIMWFIAPQITENWRRKMSAEIEIMMQESLKRALNEADQRALQMWSPTIVSPDEPGHRLQ
jgi:hypothetical protein